MPNLKIIHLLFLLSLSVLSVSSVFAQSNTETITITTYYPAPYGVYNELSVNSLVTDIAQATTAEFADMQDGDVHIGRSLIVGAGGTGYSYDELEFLEPGSPTRPGDGDVLIKGDVGIGTTSPSDKLHIYGGTLRVSNVADARLNLQHDGSANAIVGIHAAPPAFRPNGIHFSLGLRDQ